MWWGQRISLRGGSPPPTYAMCDQLDIIRASTPQALLLGPCPYLSWVRLLASHFSVEPTLLSCCYWYFDESTLTNTAQREGLAAVSRRKKMPFNFCPPLFITCASNQRSRKDIISVNDQPERPPLSINRGTTKPGSMWQSHSDKCKWLKPSLWIAELSVARVLLSGTVAPKHTVRHVFTEERPSLRGWVYEQTKRATWSIITI